MTGIKETPSHLVGLAPVGPPIAEGKTKTLYQTSSTGVLVMQHRDDITAFDGKKAKALASKGVFSNQFNAHIMQWLEESGIRTHFIAVKSDHESYVHEMTIIPLECVVRNIAAGSLCRRIGIPEKTVLDPPLFEFFLKDDALGDPPVTADHAKAFGWATDEQMTVMRSLTLEVNAKLTKLFGDSGLTLVDMKLEFGINATGDVLLSDEITPDSMRLWDSHTGEVLDKDRFRKDIGDVMEGYGKIAQALHWDVAPRAKTARASQSGVRVETPTHGSKVKTGSTAGPVKKPQATTSPVAKKRRFADTVGDGQGYPRPTSLWRYWPIVLCAVLMAFVYVMNAGEEFGVVHKTRAMLIGTATVTMMFFIVAYTARPLFELGLRPAINLLLVRRYIGLASAFSHCVHTFWVFRMYDVAPERVDPVTWVIAGPALLMYGMMMLTSNDFLQRRMRSIWWLLHVFGMHYLWAVFLTLFAKGMLENASSSKLFPVAILILAAVARGAASMGRSGASVGKQARSEIDARNEEATKGEEHPPVATRKLWGVNPKVSFRKIEHSSMSAGAGGRLNIGHTNQPPTNNG